MTVTFKPTVPSASLRDQSGRNAFPQRKPLDAPAVSKHNRIQYRAVSSWLLSRALRELNDRYAFHSWVGSRFELTAAEFPFIPDAEALADALARLYFDVLHPDRSNAEAMFFQIDGVAAMAIEVWEPSFKLKLSVAGKKGGEMSKRGPDARYTLEELLKVDPELKASKSIQARRLGCSPSHIRDLRASEAYRAHLAAASE